MMDRRTSLKWVLVASTAWPLLDRGAARADPMADAVGYGADPDLMRVYRPGELWPLILNPAQRRLAGILSDLILPADERSPSASAIGVVDFIDEWVSAPYPLHQQDRSIVVDGLAWLDAEAVGRRGLGFSDLAAADQLAICDSICDASRVAPALDVPALFFARYRDLTAGAYYSSSAGRKDLDYIGNVPLARFEGPPPALLKALGLA
jgi:hypothetical protein